MTIKEMFDILGESYMLCQTAEEACELCKAALKVVRAMEGKTPVSVKKARENLVEEIADVLVMVTVLKDGFLTPIENYDIEQEIVRKFDRFVDRIEKYRLEQTDENPTN